jgi:transcriptional antiterminator Rof (Rho-off)
MCTSCRTNDAKRIKREKKERNKLEKEGRNRQLEQDYLVNWGETTFSTGKHYGETFYEVACSDKDYITFLRNNTITNERLKDFMRWHKKVDVFVDRYGDE